MVWGDLNVSSEIAKMLSNYKKPVLLWTQSECDVVWDFFTLLGKSGSTTPLLLGLAQKNIFGSQTFIAIVAKE